jgi:hypothetical protein
VRPQQGHRRIIPRGARVEAIIQILACRRRRDERNV